MTLRYLPQLLFTFLFETRSLPEHKACQSGYLASQGVPGSHCPVLELRAHAAMSGFYVGAADQAFILISQALYSLTHVLSLPKGHFKRCVFLCVCMLLHTYTDVHVHVCAYRLQKLMLNVFLNHSAHCSLRNSPSVEPRVHLRA